MKNFKIKTSSYSMGIPTRQQKCKRLNKKNKNGIHINKSKLK